MNLYIINLLAFFCSGQDVTQVVKEAPTFEITQRRTNELSDGLKNVQKLSNYLKSIGDIEKKQPGETELQFLQRVENGTKAQALLLIDLRNEYEKLLQNRYELERLTKNYKKWLEIKDSERFKAITADKAALNAFEEEVKIETTGIILIGKRLEEYLKFVPADDKGKIDDFQENLLKFQGYLELPDEKIKESLTAAKEKFDKDKSQKRYIDSTVGMTPILANEMIKFHNDLYEICSEKKSEIIILKKKISNQESMNSMEDLDNARVKAIADGKKILEETRKLETQAHSVALLSKYVRLNLMSLNTPGRNTQLRIAEFEARLISEGNQLNQYLRILTNPDASSGQDKKSPKDLLDVFK